MGELAPLIRSERLALADFLETLTAAQWDTPSLCDEWTVQQVAAHLSFQPVQPVLASGVSALRSGFRVNRMIAQDAVRWGRRGPDAIVAQLRETAERGAKPTGMPDVTALVDAVVHPLDVRHPLGAHRSLARSVFEPVAAFFTGARWPITLPLGGSARRRLSGVRLVTDDWSFGEGSDVLASPEVAVLVLAGRVVPRGDLDGPGADVLHSRL
ncbi:MAG: maleylpyruvate isomerase family mycothiol-dependent enzyme [Nocardioidaceae bacterium]